MIYYTNLLVFPEYNTKAHVIDTDTPWVINLCFTAGTEHKLKMRRLATRMKYIITFMRVA